MPRKARRPKAPASGGNWFVYMVRCADGLLYTGIARDVDLPEPIIVRAGEAFIAVPEGAS